MLSLFSSSHWYHNVVPTVVTDLEGDKKKITTAILLGVAVPLFMFLAWNAVILGNVVGIPDIDLNSVDPIALLKNGGHGGAFLSPLVAGFSELAIITSFIAMIYGLVDAITDVTGLPMRGPEFEQWKPLLFAGALLPPLCFALINPGIFYDALDYAGAFGVSTLFLVLPPLMAWNERYGEDQKPLTVGPMVPFGKIPLASCWKAAATLIVEQGAEKLGIIQFVSDRLNI
jgi:tyrosine-specific transport protein